MTATRTIDKPAPENAGRFTSEATCLEAEDEDFEFSITNRLCWLDEGHDGPHWDDVDRVWWEFVQ